MIQPPFTPPTPPPSQSGGDLGQTIRGAVGGVLQNLSSEISKELAKETQKRDALQARLDAATSSRERATLSQQVADANVNVAKLEDAVAKLNSKAGDLTQAVPLLPGQGPALGPGAGPGTWPGTTPPQNWGPGPDYIPEQMIISIIGIIFVGFPLAIAFARILWRRANVSPAASTQQVPAEITRRFDQLEHGVDAIALEIERISENQRYLTKLLAEPKRNVGIVAGSGEPQPH